MKHSWQELADGTARCRRCPAMRRPTSKVYHVREWREVVTSYAGYEDVVQHVERDSTFAVEVSGAHPSKCGRAANVGSGGR